MTARELDLDRVNAAREQLRAPELRHLIDAASSRETTAIRELYRALGAVGLLGTQVPATYGGVGATAQTTTAVYEEIVHAGVPDTPYVLTSQIVVEFLLRFADEPLRQKYLPRMCTGEVLASVLYTEPTSGSDLGGLKTTATRRGDEFVVSGTKTYSLYSNTADIALLAARVEGISSNRYGGISLFVIELNNPGVAIELLPTVQDEQFCRVTLRDVRVPASAIVGQPGQGWELLEDALAIERTGIDHAARAFAWLRPLIAELSPASPSDERLPELGRLAMRTEVALCLSRSVAHATGSAPTAIVATAKCVASEIARDVGIQTFLHVSSERSNTAGLSSAAREAPGLTLSAGTTEMMRELFLSQVRHGDPGPLNLAATPADAAVHEAAEACVAAVLHDRRRPVPDQSPDPQRAATLWRALCNSQLPHLELAPDRGGYGLGPTVGVSICEVLGSLGVEDAYSPGAAALAWLPAQDPRAAAVARGSLIPSWTTGQHGLRLLLTDGDLHAASVDRNYLSRAVNHASDTARLHHAAYLVGAATSMLATAFSHAESRSQFEAVLAERQAVTHPLVSEAMEILALRTYLHHIARNMPADSSCSTSIRGLHLLVLDSARSAAQQALQAVGTIGLTGASSVGGMYARVLHEIRLWTHHDDSWRGIGVRVATEGENTFDWIRAS